jgi:iron complex transport system ATP-binding protein
MILSVENGCFSYKNDKNKLILNNINFKANPGEVLAILGPNGAGKTTMLRCIMGFLKWTSGKSCIDGKDINLIPYRKFWSSIAYVPQAKHAVPYTAEQMILLGRCSYFGMLSQPKSEDVDKVHGIMEKLHILKLKDKKCTEISGGELQMVLMARALAAEPKILILDEPESNLDFKNQLLILQTMSHLAANGMSCIFNTHYPAHALQRANKALLLSENGDYIFGDSHSVVTEKNIELAFGVKAVIGEIETSGNILQDIVPLHVTNKTDGKMKRADSKEQRIAVIAIITNDYNMAGNINNLLHVYNRYLIGRMGMPYHEHNLFIINVTLDAPENIVKALTSKLNVLPGVNVKTTFAPEQN